MPEGIPLMKVMEVLPKLAEEAFPGEVGKLLGYLKKQTILPKLAEEELAKLPKHQMAMHQDRLLGQIRDVVTPIYEKQLVAKGMSREQALGHIAAQSETALAHLPEQLQPKKNIYELTRPNLPADEPVLDPFKQLKPGETARRVTPSRGAAKMMNPAYRSEHVFGSKASPALDVTDAVSHWQANTAWWSKTLGMSIGKYKDIRKNPEYVKDMVEGFKSAKPHMDKIDELTDERYKLARRANAMRPQNPNRILKEKAVRLLDEEINALEAKVRGINEPLMMKWADRSADARIMIGLEDDRYPWINKMMHPEEIASRDAIRKSLDLLKARGEELGMGVITKTKYAPHPTGRILRELGKQGPAVVDAMSRYRVLPEKLKWAQRSAGSWNFWPSAHSLPKYYANSHRIMAMTPVLSKWTPILERMKGMGSKYADDANYFAKWLNDLAYGERFQTKTDKMVEMLVGAEYVDKLALSFGPAIKHAAKALKGFAFHPVYYSKGALSALNEAGEFVGRKLTGNLERSGVNPDNYARFARYYLQNRALFRGFSGIDPGKGLARYVLTTTLAQPTATVEAFERFSVMTGLMMKGLSKEASMGRALQQMYHGLLDISFVGQVDTYSWLKSPLQRFLMLFYYTPMRVTEQSLKTLAYAALPEKFVTKTAANALQYAAHMRTDPLGGTYYGKLVRAALVIGGAEAIARANDSSIYEWATLHMPFLRESRTGEPEVVMPPIVDVINNINRLGWGTQAFLAALSSHYGMYSAQRIFRFVGGDEFIPEIYKPPGSSEMEHKLRAFFSLPSLEAMEVQHAKYAPMVLRARQQRFEQLKRQGRWREIVLEGFLNMLNYTGAALTLPDSDPEEEKR